MKSDPQTLKINILKRIDQLRDAIAYSRDQMKGMSFTQGIACNQEIAQWFRVLEGQSTPNYIIPKHLEDKVQSILKLIKEKQWKRPKIRY